MNMFGREHYKSNLETETKNINAVHSTSVTYTVAGQRLADKASIFLESSLRGSRTASASVRLCTLIVR